MSPSQIRRRENPWCKNQTQAPAVRDKRSLLCTMEKFLVTPKDFLCCHSFSHSQTLSLAVRNRGSSLKASLTSLLNLLNNVSSSSTYFSESCKQKHNLYKMKTIGDQRSLTDQFWEFNGLAKCKKNKVSSQNLKARIRVQLQDNIPLL